MVGQLLVDADMLGRNVLWLLMNSKWELSLEDYQGSRYLLKAMMFTPAKLYGTSTFQLNWPTVCGEKQARSNKPVLCDMNDTEVDSELESLRSFYADLDVRIVDAAWEESGHDYKMAMEELAIAVKSPGAAARLLNKEVVSGSWAIRAESTQMKTCFSSFRETQIQ
jgi:hypothetical protein